MSNFITAQVSTLRAAGVRGWAAFVGGNALIAAGVGLLIASSNGTGALDALTVGASVMSGLSVGTWAIIVSVILTAVSIALGIRFMVGTVIGFVIVGFGIDAVLAVAPVFTHPVAAWGEWLAGGVLLAIGAGLTIASKVGASAYDAVTLGIARFVKGKVGIARLIIDAIVVAVAFVIGGPVGAGTVGMMILMPVLMPLTIKAAHRLVAVKDTEYGLAA